MIDPSLRQQVEQAARSAAQRAGDIDPADWLERLMILFCAATVPPLAAMCRHVAAQFTLVR